MEIAGLLLASSGKCDRGGRQPKLKSPLKRLLFLKVEEKEQEGMMGLLITFSVIANNPAPEMCL